MERLFVYEDEHRLLFSSEAKAILAAIPETRHFNAQGLAEFLACGCTFGENTLFQGIRALPAGSVLVLDEGRGSARRTYFDPIEWEQGAPLPEQTFLAHLGSAFDNAVRRHTTTPPGVAVSLTGGFDSRMIMAALKAPTGAVPCYTFGSTYRDTHDVRVSRAVADRCGQPHRVLVLGAEFVREAPAHLEKAVFVSDGYMGLSGAAELYLNAQARTIAPVRITGNYGGELLRGFRAFKASVPRGDFLVPEFRAEVEAATHSFAAMAQMKPLSFTLFRQAPAGYGRYALERSQVTVRSPFLDDSVTSLLYRAPSRSPNGDDTSTFLIRRHRPELLTIATDRGYLGNGGKLGQSLRRAYRELLFKGEYLTGHGAPDWMVALTSRRSGRALETLFLGRHKFFHPLVWFRGSLGEYARDLLLGASASVLDPYVDMPRIPIMLRQHLAGERNYWDGLDRLMTITLAHRTLCGPRVN
jgi:asparagine synthase (glutamine-hydrolysing)